MRHPNPVKEYREDIESLRAAIRMWVNDHPETPEYCLPSERELVGMLMRKLRRSKLCLRAALTHAKRTNAYWHKVPKNVIQIWERQL